MAKSNIQPTKNFLWENEFDKEHLYRTLASFRNVKDGRTSYNAFEHKFWLPVLMSAVRANTPIAQRYKRRCIRASFSDSSLNMTNPDKFLQRCENELKKITARPLTKFHILLHVTYQGPNLLTWLRDGQTTIRWNPSLRNKVYMKAVRSRDDIKASLDKHRIPAISDKLTPILVTTLALDQVDAQRQAMDAVDRFRAIVNLVINSNRRLNVIGFNNEIHAINRLRLGPFWTAHREDGSLVSEVFWYEPRWEHRADSAKFSGDPRDVRTQLRKWIRKSRSNPLSDAISAGLLRYCRALDLHDTDAVLLGLWGALENLTGTQNSKYDLTVSRIIRLFDDTDDAKLLAQHLRVRRNATVHAARSPDDDEVDTVLFHAEWLVSRILVFFIQEGRMFKDHPEALQFLDIDLNTDALAVKAALTKKFVEYRNRSGT